MADLKKQGNQYIANIRKWNGKTQATIAYIPLRTNIKSEAIIRLTEVKKNEKYIKQGIILKHQFIDFFPWLNDKGVSELKPLTLEESIEMFTQSYKMNIAESSMKRIKVSLNRAVDIWKSNTPISIITEEHIEEFKKAYIGIHSNVGINLNLRNIKTFIRWCFEKKYLNQLPKIRMVKCEKGKPKYISEHQFNTIMNLKSINSFYKKLFYIYHSTGCRRSEIIEGILNKNTLIIPAHISKSRIEKEISIDDNQRVIIQEIQKERDRYLDRNLTLESFKGNISKQFKKACKELNLNFNLHCLRHTYAVRQWIITNDIYEVKKLMGHTSVTTTEIYANFSLNRLKDDFPSDYSLRLEIDKIRESGIRGKDISGKKSQEYDIHLYN